MQLMLIRHGETQHNVENRMSGWTDVSLNTRGEQQARQLGGRLKTIPVDLVITSGMRRARQTAEIAFSAAGYQQSFETWSSFREMNFGSLESMTMEEIHQNYPQQYEEMMQKKGVFMFPQGESLQTFHERIKAASRLLFQRHAGKRIALVSHSGTIRSFLAEWIAGDWKTHWRFQVDHCTITKVSFHEQFPVLHFFNESTHLNDLN